MSIEIIIMSLYQLLQMQTPIAPQNWTKKQKNQYRFGGTRYSFQGTTHNPSSIVLQVGSNYSFPNGEQDISQTINQETINRINQN